MTEIAQAEFAAVDSAAPPRADDPAWTRVTLPDVWRTREVAPQGGWYRLRVRLALPQEAHGIYLGRFHLNAGVFLNGQYLGDGGRFTEPIARNWNRPLYFTVPGALWAGDNEILVRLRSYPGFGSMYRVWVGPERLLKPVYERQLFYRIQLMTTLALALAAVSVFMFGLWWRRRGDRQYLWFALACACWALFASYLVVRDPPIPGQVFRWLAHGALDWWAVCIAVFVHRYAGEKHVKLEWTFAGLAAMGMALTAVTSGTQHVNLSRVFHLESLIIVFYLAWFAWRRWRASHRRELGLLALALGVISIAGLHDSVLNLPIELTPDWLMQNLPQRGLFHIFNHTAPLVFLFLAWHLTGRFVSALNEAETLNKELEARIAAAKHALEQSYQAQRDLERDQAAAQERERIYGDLHDDLGAKLLSLAIGAENPQRADLARAALQDLRDVVSRSGNPSAPLSDALADWRAEIEQRARSAGLACDWRQAPLQHDPGVSAGAALQIGRILREATSNVLRHARATRLAVAAVEHASDLLISVADDGVGMQVMHAGRGMRNMRARAAHIGAQITWENAQPQGCHMQLRVPLERLNQEPIAQKLRTQTSE